MINILNYETPILSPLARGKILLPLPRGGGRRPEGYYQGEVAAGRRGITQGRWPQAGGVLPRGRPGGGLLNNLKYILLYCRLVN
jgi:hypothetical protein